MLRTAAINARDGHADGSARLLARTDLQGRVATTVAPAVNRMNTLRPARALIEKATGIAKDRLLPTYAHEKFSTWFRRRRPAPTQPTAVTLFATCMVEYQEPAIGQAIVGVCERNGITCQLPDGQICCGMPWLDAGDVAKFEDHARRNVDALIDSVRAGHEVIVPQPTCAYVLKNEVPDFLGTDDARLVAEHTFDVSEYLMARHRARPLDTTFPGPTYETITWHAACHYRAQQIGPKSLDLMALTGATVTTIERCSAIDGTWGLRAQNVEMARRIAQPLMDAVGEATTDLVAGDCHLANNAIREATTKVPVHPIQVLARAYGLEGD
jgi:Fe-S oxidoreductase